MKFCIHIFILLLLGGCDMCYYRIDSFAKENADTLKCVLRHYKHESLKLKAAKYLIYNMQYHYSYPAAAYEKYCAHQDSLFLLYLPHDILAIETEKLVDKYADALIPICDAQCLSASALIDHIDSVFELWQNGNCMQHLDFDDFCEYVLPYKCIPGQPYNDWKAAALINEGGKERLMNQISAFENSVRFRYRIVCDYLASNHVEGNEMQRVDAIPLYHPAPLLHSPYDNCFERAVLALMYYRANGIPASIDYVPNWMDRGGSHYWVNLMMTTHHNEAIEPLQSYGEPPMFEKYDLRMPKVYRMTWKPRDVMLDALNDDQPLPESLNNIFVRDVTNEYCRTTDIRIRMNAGIDKYVFLAVFDDNSWRAVDIAKRRGDIAKFKNVGIGGTYCIMEYGNGRLRQVSVPFYVSLKKEVQMFRADQESVHNVMLTRKYPSRGHIYEIRNTLVGGSVSASNDSLFRISSKIGECCADDILSGNITVADTSSYRYWQFTAPKNATTDIAEIYFYERFTGKRLYPELCGKYRNYPESYYFEVEHIQDNDPLSFTRFIDNTSVENICFDFRKSVSIDEILYIKRGDGNDILPGDVYELYYNSGERWVMHERKVAGNIYVEFHDVPSNALLYIKCVSRGHQNRIFTYDGNTITWR